jgi:hypothetical protein
MNTFVCILYVENTVRKIVRYVSGTHACILLKPIYIRHTHTVLVPMDRNNLSFPIVHGVV